MDPEGRLDFLLGDQRYMRERIRDAKREGDNTKDRDELLINKVDEEEGVLRESNGIDHDNRVEAIGSLNKEMKDPRKELETAHAEAGMAIVAPDSSNAEVCRNGPRGPRIDSGFPPKGPRPTQGGRGPRQRVNAIAWRIQRDIGNASQT